MPSSVAVTCPQGCEPGSIIFVTTKSGLDIEVEVPEGVAPGEIFDVEFEHVPLPRGALGEPAALSPVRKLRGVGDAADQHCMAILGRAGAGREWDSRFAIEGSGWASPEPYVPQLSPGSQQMAPVANDEVWDRMSVDQTRRAESHFQRVAEGESRATEGLQSKPTISKGSEQLTRGQSPAKRRQRLLQDPRQQRAASPPARTTEFDGSRWNGRSARSPHRVVNRLTEDAHYRMRQREVELQRQADVQHTFSPRINARSVALVTMLPNATQTLQSPAEARQRSSTTRLILTNDELIAKIRTQLRAAAHGREEKGAKASVDYRRLYQRYSSDQLHGMSYGEFRGAVRADGKVDRSAMPDRELTVLYRSLAGPNGRIQLKEFKAFLSTKNKPEVSARLLKADTTATASDLALITDLEGKSADLAALEAKKLRALESEDYEEAAALRDQIVLLQSYIDDHTKKLDTV